MASIKKYYPVLGCCLLLAAATAAQTLAQTEAKDKADAVRIAHQASRYLQQTQDIRLLLRKYAVKNFLNGAVKEPWSNVFGALDEGFLPKLDASTQEDYYVAASNWFYFAIVYTFNHKPKISASGGDDVVFPPGVEKLMHGKPVLSTWLSDSDENIPKPKTEKEVRKTVIDIEKVNSIYRKRLRSIKTKPYQAYLSMAKKGLDQGSEFFKPEVSRCDSGSDFMCLGLPRDSRLIIMHVPGFYYAAFSRVNGRMKILHIMQGPGD